MRADEMREITENAKKKNELKKAVLEQDIEKLAKRLSYMMQDLADQDVDDLRISSETLGLDDLTKHVENDTVHDVVTIFKSLGYDTVLSKYELYIGYHTERSVSDVPNHLKKQFSYFDLPDVNEIRKRLPRTFDKQVEQAVNDIFERINIRANEGKDRLEVRDYDFGNCFVNNMPKESVQRRIMTKLYNNGFGVEHQSGGNQFCDLYLVVTW